MDVNIKVMSKREKNCIVSLSVIMVFIIWMAIKLPMPALPSLSTVFHASHQVFKLSVSLTLIAFAASFIFWGTLSDRYGRKPIILSAFVLAMLGTLIIIFANTFYLYILGRIIEGFAIGMSAPLIRLVLTDCLNKVEVAKAYALCAIAAILPPAVGPIIGGYLLTWFGWRSIFIFFLMLGLSYLIICYLFFPETIQQKKQKISIKEIVLEITSIAKSASFWRYVIPYSLISGFMIAYYAAMPFWFIVHFHMHESTYAWQAFLPISAYIAGSSLSTQLLNVFNMERIFVMGIYCVLIVAFGVALLALFYLPNKISMNVIIMLFSVASGIIVPITNANLLSLFKDKVSSLTLLLSGSRITTAGLLVMISANISLNTFWPLASYMLCISVISYICYYKLD